MFNWGKMPDDNAFSANSLVKKRVAGGVDKALQAKGYSIGTEDAFDFVAIIHAGAGIEIESHHNQKLTICKMEVNIYEAKTIVSIRIWFRCCPYDCCAHIHGSYSAG